MRMWPHVIYTRYFDCCLVLIHQPVLFQWLPLIISLRLSLSAEEHSFTPVDNKLVEYLPICNFFKIEQENNIVLCCSLFKRGLVLLHIWNSFLSCPGRCRRWGECLVRGDSSSNWNCSYRVLCVLPDGNEFAKKHTVIHLFHQGQLQKHQQ